MHGRCRHDSDAHACTVNAWTPGERACNFGVVPVSHLPRSKFVVPRARPSLVTRPRLLDPLRAALADKRVVVVSAMAGAGKTTLVAQAVRDVPRLAWVSLDEDDDTQLSVVRAIARALGVEAPTGVDAHSALNLLLDGVEERTILVLDDLHVLSAEAQALVRVIAEHGPPELTLVVTTRHSPDWPLAKLKARDELVVIEASALRMSLDEAAQLLGSLGLDAKTLEAVHARTGGWAAALTLMRSLAGHVVAEQQGEDVFTLIADEVLSRESDDTRALLERLSILDELDPAVCAAVTGREDVATVLDDLGRRNLLIDGRRMHALLRELLLARAQTTRATELVELHRKAALVETNSFRAVRHWLAAGEPKRAAERLERDVAVLAADVDALAAAIMGLPHDAQTPLLMHWLGVHAWTRGDFARASALWRSSLERETDDANRAETLVQLATVEQTRSNFPVAAQLLVEASTLPLSPRSHAQLHMGMAYLALGADDQNLARNCVTAAIDVADTTRDEQALLTCAMQLRACFLLVPGGTELLERFVGLCRGRASIAVQAAAASHQLFVHLARAELAPAGHAATRVTELADRMGWPAWLMVDTGALAAIVFVLNGDNAAADRALAQHVAIAESYAEWRPGLLAMHARARLMQGRIDDARALRERMQVRLEREWPIGGAARAMVDGLVAAAEGRRHDAERFANASVDDAPALSRLFGDGRLLLARLHEDVDTCRAVVDEYAARDAVGLLLFEGPALLPLLRTAVERGASGLERVMKPLARVAVASPADAEALTARELEVLRLVTRGLTNRDIATALEVSVPTVKTHVARLLVKLEVASRTEAAARAREMHLV